MSHRLVGKPASVGVIKYKWPPPKVALDPLDEHLNYLVYAQLTIPEVLAMARVARDDRSLAAKALQFYGIDQAQLKQLLQQQFVSVELLNAVKIQDWKTSGWFFLCSLETRVIADVCGVAYERVNEQGGGKYTVHIVSEFIKNIRPPENYTRHSLTNVVDAMVGGHLSEELPIRGISYSETLNGVPDGSSKERGFAMFGPNMLGETLYIAYEKATCKLKYKLNPEYDSDGEIDEDWREASGQQFVFTIRLENAVSIYCQSSHSRSKWHISPIKNTFAEVIVVINRGSAAWQIAPRRPRIAVTHQDFRMFYDSGDITRDCMYF